MNDIKTYKIKAGTFTTTDGVQHKRGETFETDRDLTGKRFSGAFELISSRPADEKPVVPAKKGKFSRAAPSEDAEGEAQKALQGSNEDEGGESQGADDSEDASDVSDAESYTRVPTGGGMFDVIRSGDGKKMNKNPLNKIKAKRFIERLTSDTE